MIRCTRCVMSSTRPSTAFIDGVCSACLNFDRRADVDWPARRADLLQLLDRHGGKCVVASSGGKDSTYIAVTLRDLGATPLVVTATTDHLTPIGRANIDNLARLFPTIEVSPGHDVRGKIMRIGLETVGDVSLGEHASIWTVPLRVAIQQGYDLIFYGENPQDEYGGPSVESGRKAVMGRRWVSEHGGFLGLRMSDLIGREGIRERDLYWYTYPSEDEIVASGAVVYFLGAFLPWDSQHNAAVAIEYGMKVLGVPPCTANWWNHENLDNAATGLHDHLRWAKYRYGRAADQLSMDIRRGRITRDKALDVLREREHLFPLMYAGSWTTGVYARMGMTRAQYIAVEDRFVNRELFAGRQPWGDLIPVEQVR